VSGNELGNENGGQMAKKVATNVFFFFLCSANSFEPVLEKAVPFLFCFVYPPVRSARDCHHAARSSVVRHFEVYAR